MPLSKPLLQQPEQTDQIFWNSPSIWVLSLFTVTFFIYKDFDIRMMFGFSLLVLIIVMQSLKQFILKKKQINSTSMEPIFLALIGALVMCCINPMSNKNLDTLSYFIALIICTPFAIFSVPLWKEFKAIHRTFLIAALCFSAFVIFFSFFQPQFWLWIYPHLSISSQEYALRFIDRGYSPAIGGSATYVIYVIFAGLTFVYAQLISTNESKVTQCRLLLLFGVLFLALIMVGRRGELCTAILSFFVVTILNARPGKRFKIIIYLTLILVALAVVFFSCLSFFEKVPFLSRYVLTTKDLLAGKDISSGRTILYGKAIDIFMQEPLFGIGWGNFGQHVTEAFRAVHGQDVKDVHNIYLHFLCETGIVGTIFLILPLAYIYQETFKQTVQTIHCSTLSRENLHIKKLNIISLLLQTFFLVLGLIDPCFYKLIFWCFYAIAFSFANTALKLRRYETSKRLNQV